MRNAGRVLLLMLVSTALWCADAKAQTFMRDREFLNLGTHEQYLNYGREPFEPYPTITNSRNRYDRLGGYLFRGFDVFNWEFSRPGYSSISTRSDQYGGWFNNVVILNDSYRGWDFGLTMGEDIRIKLTDLTVKDPRYFGIVFDGSSSDNRFTLLLRQGGFIHNVGQFSKFQSTTERSPVLGFGGHWESKIGDILTLGATYYNQRMVDTFNENGSLLRGDMPHNMLAPSSIEVVVEDDSPDDGGTPAVVYGIDIIITGTSQGSPVRMTSINTDADYDPMLEAVGPTGGELGADGGYRVQGAGTRALFEFIMPMSALPDPAEYAADPTYRPQGLTIESVRFVADVAGDFRIGVRQEHLRFDAKAHEKNVTEVAEEDERYLRPDHSECTKANADSKCGSRYKNPYTGLTGQDGLLTPAQARDAGEDVFNSWPVTPDDATVSKTQFKDYKWDQAPNEVYYTVVRSDGNSATVNNRRRVSFDYGIPTGQSLLGMNGELKLHGVTVSGEFVTNPQHFVFPVGSNAGKRYTKRRWAYFLNATRDVGPVQLGGEFFRLDPDYSGNYDAFRGGVPFFTDEGSKGADMEEFFVMADNDDNDQWPDDFLQEWMEADKVDGGIFPGLDENFDLVPDSDQNLNGIPDWTEPVLFYDADPPAFTYGIDFNNNGVVDYRENDRLPDYPYRRDRKGWHAFLMRDGLRGFGKWVTMGMYGLEETAGGGEASALYARYEYGYRSPFFGKIALNADVKWVEDSIRDDVYIWQDYTDEKILSPFPQYTGKNIERWDLNSQWLPPPPDPLDMRNSFVSTVFVESRYTQILGLNVINNLQWLRNARSEDEFDDGSMQEDDVVSLFTMVNKTDYTIRIGDFSLRPMFKHLLLRRHSDLLDRETGKGSMESFSIWSPILRTQMTLTAKSDLQVALQGFPFWKYRRSDRVNDLESFKQWTLIVMMSNRSDQYGFNLGSQFGWMTTNREYDEAVRKTDNFDNSRIFLDLVAGW